LPNARAKLAKPKLKPKWRTQASANIANPNLTTASPTLEYLNIRKWKMETGLFGDMPTLFILSVIGRIRLSTSSVVQDDTKINNNNTNQE
jgi:hypothetical protein